MCMYVCIHVCMNIWIYECMYGCTYACSFPFTYLPLTACGVAWSIPPVWIWAVSPIWKAIQSKGMATLINSLFLFLTYNPETIKKKEISNDKKDKICELRLWIRKFILLIKKMQMNINEISWIKWAL